MKCPKCEKELSENSKFCNTCGAKIEEKEKSMSELFHESVKSAELLWFSIGFIKGSCKHDEEKKKWFKEVFEKDMFIEPEFAKEYDYVNSEYNKNFPQKEKK